MKVITIPSFSTYYLFKEFYWCKAISYSNDVCQWPVLPSIIMSWRRPLHSIATAITSLWGTLHQSSQKVLGTWYLMSQPNSFDHQGLCLPSVTFPHNWEAVSKKHAKISSRILKQVPSNNVALLLCPNQTLVAGDSIFKKVHAFFRVNLTRML